MLAFIEIFHVTNFISECGIFVNGTSKFRFSIDEVFQLYTFFSPLTQKKKKKSMDVKLTFFGNEN